MNRIKYRAITQACLTEAILDRMEELELRCGLEPYSRDMLRCCVETMENLGAFDGDQLVGFLTMGWTNAYCGGSLYLVNRNVEPEYRGRDLAKKLLYGKLRERNPFFPGKLVSLDVTRSNRVRSLYQKLGFRKIDTPSRNGPEVVVMAAGVNHVLECLDTLRKEE